MKRHLLFLPSSRCSLESTCDDLAANLDASEVGERSDRGRLASPLFPQERETSANPFGIYHSSGESSEASLSHLHTGIEKSKARSHNKRKSSRDLGVARGPHLKRENILSEQKEIHNFLERKADQAFRGERAAQTRLSEAHSELDRCRVLIELFMDRVSNFIPRGWNFIKRIN